MPLKQAERGQLGLEILGCPKADDFHQYDATVIVPKNEVRYEHLLVLVKSLAFSNELPTLAFLRTPLPGAVMQQAESLELGGEKRRVSILMSDLVGFTPLTESLEPTQVVALLNNHLGAMIAVIQAHGGTIDEFIGDAILAFFGAPLAREDDSARAVACALAMQAAMAEVNARNQTLGLPDIEMRIAVATGDVVIGNIGSERRSKYAAVGGAINLAARIESHTGSGEGVICDATSRDVADAVHVTETRRVEAKGFDGLIRVHRVSAIEGSFEL